MTESTTATADVQIDDHQFRVTKWDFPPGTQTGVHIHEYDYVVVPLSAGTLSVKSADGVTNNHLVPGASYQRSAGAKHNLVNESNNECSFVEIEIKGA